MSAFVFVIGLLAMAAGDPLLFRPDADVHLCPDKQGTCPDNSTCCLLLSGKYGCCPLVQAECCSDHLHCCPHGYQCNLAQQTCTLGDRAIPWFTKQAAQPASPDSTPEVKVTDVVCPGGQYTCPTGSTCCKLQSGTWGCCQMPNAVCCADGLHCCPSGYQCDVAHGTCYKAHYTHTWFEPLPAGVKQGAGQVKATAAGKKCSVTCDDPNTCCPGGSADDFCCLLPKAKCCDDGKHCCPNGFDCHVDKGTCYKVDNVNTWFKVKSAEGDAAADVATVTCPGGQFSCATGQTCCKLPSGTWGCCPFPQALCCSDGLHCCPSGYTCNVAAGSCQKAEGSSFLEPLIQTPAARSQPPSAQPTTCPDETSFCEGGRSCCEGPDGESQCCPFSRGVCCGDQQHCCPAGFTCDAKRAKCTKEGGISMPLASTKPAETLVGESAKEESITCPDRSECPSGSTCCATDPQKTKFGCCPMAQATCCADYIHCCPGGTTCSPSQGRCIHGDGSTSPLLAKTPSRSPRLSAEGSHTCPDNKSTCPDSTTCCQMLDGWYGCCPFPNALCCPDHLHCCPEGQTCDTGRGLCESSATGATVPWGLKIPATPTPATPTPATPDTQPGDVICPDKQSTCPDGSTCCEISAGLYGCCPLVKAVCCSDHTHCCPSGYTCNVAKTTCDHSQAAFSIPLFTKTPSRPLGDGDVIPWAEKVPAEPLGSTEGAVICPDKASQCQDGYTCCKLISGQYGCCPLAKAVCCADHIHCCPSGTTCDVAKGSCLSDTNSFQLDWDMVQRGTPMVATPVAEEGATAVESVQCEDHTECPRGSTCCAMQSGKYGCCPMVNATCCSDKIHCCPSGFTCDVTGSKCSKADGTSLEISLTGYTRTQAKKPAATVTMPSKDTVCPGGQVTCPSGNTCCKLTSGGYGCCPIPNAVCCADGQHCCPSGFACDPQSGTCTQEGAPRSLTWFTKTEATPIPPLSQSNEIPDQPMRSDAVICPDRRHECPDRNTCCRQISAQWGCCPLPNAVCCSDGQHCCPRGYRCSPQSGMCLREGSATDIASYLSLTPLSVP